MKSSILKIFFGISFLLQGTSGHAQVTGGSIDLTWNLRNRELVYTKYFQVTRDLNDLNSIEALRIWVNRMNNEKNDWNVRTYVPKAYQAFKTSIKSKSIIDLAAHYFYTNNKEGFVSALSYYYWQSAMFLYLNATDPRVASNESPKAESLSWARKAFDVVNNVENCLNTSYKRSNAIAIDELKSLKSQCLDKNTDLSAMMNSVFSITSQKSFKGAPVLLNASGFIPGNKILQITQNNTTPEYVSKLGVLNSKYKSTVNATLNKKYIDMTLEDFKTVMTRKEDALKLFTENGLPESLDPQNANGHPGFLPTLPNGAPNSFGEIYAAIGRAKKTIFVDVYFFGGSMGAMLAKNIIQQMQDENKKDLRVVILNDRNNAMAYNLEMQPVYHFMRAYAEKFGEGRMLVMVPKIDLKRTSMPSFVDLLVSDEAANKALGTEVVQNLMQNNKIYPKAKSDHSKVYLVDAYDATSGVAFVGSKNMTDSSGGVSYDEVTKMEGPAVPAIQDSYFYDIQEALKNDTTFSKINSAMSTLNAFDALGRADAAAKKSMSYPAKGDGIVSLGENNVYGSLRLPLIQDIQAIMTAKKQIIISEQFVYDPYIVKALIEAKHAAAGRGEKLDIFILLATINGPIQLLEPEKVKFAHVPNIFFLKDMMATGIQIKWKHESKAMIDALLGAKALGAELSPEYHLKTISVDGVLASNQASCQQIANEAKIVENPSAMKTLADQMERLPLLISGSANKDNMTMIGGFREFQVVVYDKTATAKHDCLFWSRWNSPQSSREVKVDEQFQIPDQLKAKGIANTDMLEFLKEFFLGVYNFQINFF